MVKSVEKRRSYGKLAKVGVVWGFLREGGNTLLLLPTSMILARLLTPREAGVAAAATFFMQLCARLTQFGFGASLVRNKHITYRPRVFSVRGEFRHRCHVLGRIDAARPRSRRLPAQCGCCRADSDCGVRLSHHALRHGADGTPLSRHALPRERDIGVALNDRRKQRRDLPCMERVQLLEPRLWTASRGFSPRAVPDLDDQVEAATPLLARSNERPVFIWRRDVRQERAGFLRAGTSTT